MRVLVCGGREFRDLDLLTYVLGRLHRGGRIAVLIHGAARGADALAGTWAGIQGVPVEAYPADWKAHGKRAGYLRNRQMLEEGKPDLVVAFPGGRGTKMMVEIAWKAGVRVLEIPHTRTARG